MGDREQTCQNVVEQFCKAWFEARNVEKTLEYLCSDIQYIGTAQQEAACGLEAMRAYLTADIQALNTSFSVTFPSINCRLLQPALGTVFTEIILQNSQCAALSCNFFILLCK